MCPAESPYVPVSLTDGGVGSLKPKGTKGGRKDPYFKAELTVGVKRRRGLRVLV